MDRMETNVNVEATVHVEDNERTVECGENEQKNANEG